MNRSFLLDQNLGFAGKSQLRIADRRMPTPITYRHQVIQTERPLLKIVVQRGVELLIKTPHSVSCDRIELRFQEVSIANQFQFPLLDHPTLTTQFLPIDQCIGNRILPIEIQLSQTRLVRRVNQTLVIDRHADDQSQSTLRNPDPTAVSKRAAGRSVVRTRSVQGTTVERIDHVGLKPP